MNTGRKFLLFTTLLLTLYAAAIMINATVNFRNFSIQSTEQKADLTAAVVREGLTTMMINGTINKRDIFLDAIRSPESIRKLWVIRSRKVIDQYGPGLHREKPHDAIDREVLTLGHTVKRLEESADRATYRITIPYIATSTGEKNCLQCHKVAEGDVLGAISIEFDITDTRLMGLWTLIRIGVISLLFLVLAIFAVRRLSRPYIDFFQALQNSLVRVKEGDFSLTIDHKSGSDDIARSAALYNLLIEKFQSTIGTVEEKLSTLLRYQSGERLDPLERAAATIDTLSKIQHFKSAIENDASLQQIYEHLADAIRMELGAKSFVIYSVDTLNNRRDIAYSTLKSLPCSETTMEDAALCRAVRTKGVVESDQFPHLCRHYRGAARYYYCIPFAFHNHTIVVMLMADETRAIERYKNRIHILRNYLENAKPVIESRILMDKLHEKSLKDGLTGIYNRKFLEEMIDKIDNQSRRFQTHYAVLMIDIDRFKKINDTYGHGVGDIVIRKLADTVRSTIRDADIPARYGGEEFVVLLHESSAEGGVKVAEKIRERFAEQEILVAGERIRATVSIGVAHFPEHADSLRKSIELADHALYEAKHSGRNRVILFAPNKVSKTSKPV